MRLVMRQVCTQQLRLEQRLEMRLEQTIQLLQLQVARTEGEKDNEQELKALRKMLKDIDGDEYSSLDDFMERVGKRVLKKNRTEGTKSIVAFLRELPCFLPVTFDFVRAVVQAALSVGTKGQIPSDELADLRAVLSSPAVVASEARLVVYRLFEASAVSDGEYVPVLAVLETAACKLEMSPGVYRQFLIRVTEICSRRRFVEALRKGLYKVTPTEPSLSQVAHATNLLIEHEDLVGHLYGQKVPSVFAEYVKMIGDKDNSKSNVLKPFLFADSSDEGNALAGYCSDAYVLSSKDNLRIVFQVLNLFSARGMYSGLHLRLASIASSARQFVKLCEAALQAFRLRQLSVPDDGVSYEEALLALKNSTTVSAFARLPFRYEYRDRIAASLGFIPPRLLDMLVSLATIYDRRHQKGMEILARITEATIDRNFHEWRYGHAFSKMQLRPVSGAKAWIENVYARRILADADDVRTRLAAVRLLGAEAHAIFEEMFDRPWTSDLAGKTQVEIQEISRLFSDGDLPPIRKKLLGREKQLLIKRYRCAIAVQSMSEMSEEEVGLLKGALKQAVRSPWIGKLQGIVEQANEIMECDAFDSSRIFVIRETDMPMETMDVGVSPVQTCQRWTSTTSYNKCLLAYVVDSNKKVWYFGTRDNPKMGRAVVRYAPYKKSALILLEKVYATHWSEDHTRAFVLTMLQKASRMSLQTGKPIFVGFAGWREQNMYYKLFKELAEELNGKLTKVTTKIRLLPSLNEFEYADSLGGQLDGEGPKHAVGLTYLTVDTAAEAKAQG